MEILKDRRQAGLCMDRWAIKRDLGDDLVEEIEERHGDWNTFLFETFGIVADEFQNEQELQQAIHRLHIIGFPLNYGYVVKNKASLIGAAKKFAKGSSWNTYAQNVIHTSVGCKRHTHWDSQRLKKFILERHKKGLPLGSYKLSRDGFNQPMRIAKKQKDYPGRWKDFVQQVIQSSQG